MSIDHDDSREEGLWGELAWFIALGVVSLLGIAFELAGLESVAEVALLVATLILSSRFVVELVSESKFTVDLLMAFVGAVSLYYGFALEGLIVLALYSVAEVLEERVERLAERSISSAVKLLPKKALVVRDREAVEVDVESIEPGDVVIVRVGEAVPADGLSLSGGLVDMSVVTGESIPVRVRPGTPLPSGSVVIEGPVRVRVSRRPSDSFVQRLVREAVESMERRPRVTRLLEKYTPHMTVAVLSLFAMAHLMVGPERALSIVLAGCPSAFIIGSSFEASYLIARAARRGALIRGGEALERGKSIKAVVLDKTGTLTRPKIILNGSQREREILRLAAAVAVNSRHPIARAIAMAYPDPGLAVEQVREVKGRGIEAVVQGRRVWIGQGSLPACEKSVKVQVEGLGAAEFCVQDEVDPASHSLIQYFRRRGFRVIMASGDRREAVETVARSLGVDEFYYEMKPQDKAGLVEKIRRESGPTAFVGDGVNDAVAMARSDFSIAVGDLSLTRAVADAVAPGGASQVLLIFSSTEGYWKGLLTAFATAALIKAVIASLGLIGLLPLPLVALLGDDGSTIAAVAAGAILSSKVLETR
ncbi:MAG: cadmium-translocating P-type ATPase [Desulfurococcales archaeon]|nr:cadmium-translocating P-type ATPase [Desulfurococcales archaeon]